VKVFVSVDLEGISGVFSEAQTAVGTAEYQVARRYMQADVEAAVEGALAAGATEVVISDGHEHGSNLAYDWMPAGVSLVSGSPAPLSMMHGVDGGFDAALLIGYHARAGTTGAILEHTYSYDIFRVRVDEYLEVGEVGINAALAGLFGVPVVFISGDDKVAEEARELLPGMECAVVKYGSYRTAARQLSPEEAHAAIQDGVLRALGSRAAWPAPLDFTGRPMRVTFTRTSACDAAMGCPTVERVDARTLDIPPGDYRQVFKAFLTCVNLAFTTRV
jgi:D-amino peptidase